MKTISIKQPWAYLIASGIKDIENRTWKCPQKYIGKRVLIHVSAKPLAWHSVVDSLTSDMAWVVIKNGYNGRWLRDLRCGAIIGSVEIVDCVVNHSSIWAEKQHCTYHSPCKDLTKLPNCFDGCIHFSKPIYNWVLSSPILFEEPILNVKGKLGFWDYEFSEDDYECTNDNGHTLGSCGEKVGCIQDCGECDYYKCKYEI